jgi:hypothetical protein
MICVCTALAAAFTAHAQIHTDIIERIHFQVKGASRCRRGDKENERL